MAVDTPSMFAAVIQEHLELKRRNSTLEHEMPLERYMEADPFENHPLFKTEEQARIEDTMDGVQGIESHETSLDWPTTEDTFIEEPQAPPAGSVDQPTQAHPAVSGDAVSGDAVPSDAEPDERSDETLWSRSRDFDWGD